MTRPPGRDLDSLGDGEMAGRIRAFDWSATPLGPIENWEPRWISALASVLHTKFQAVIYLGPELICLYNDAEIETLGSWHPAALGTPASIFLATMWDVVGPKLASVMAGGEATWSEDEPLLFDRQGLEEVFFTYSYSPILDEHGTVNGVLLVTHETTGRVIGERHLRALRELASGAAGSTSSVAVCDAAVRALTGNPDIPFALAYLADGEGVLRLAASAGLSFSTASSDQMLAAVTGAAVQVLDVPGTGHEPGPRHAIAVPIVEPGETSHAGLLIAGLVDVRPIDERQIRFFELVGGQIGAALAGHRAQAAASATAERRQIERNLHDSVQQHLLAAKVLSGLAHDAAAADSEEVRAKLVVIGDELDVAMSQLHDIVKGVYPSTLGDEGLAAALRATLTGSPVNTEILTEGLDRLPQDIEEAIYYLCLEALQNAAKHGDSTTSATVTLSVRDDALHVRITDTGPGFDPGIPTTGMGLDTMRSRVERLGGTFTITSATGHGTRLDAQVPLGRHRLLARPSPQPEDVESSVLRDGGSRTPS
jgi:signal transduction histidine kinase